MKKLAWIEKTLPLIGNMLLPAFIFALALLSFYLQRNYSSAIAACFHIGFYLLGFSGFLALLYFNRSQPAFSLLLITLAYILINCFKHAEGDAFWHAPAYISLSTLLPLNLLFFYFWPPQHLLCRRNIWLLLVIFFQYALVEHLSHSGFAVGIMTAEQTASLNLASWLAFTALLGVGFINAVRSGTITDYNFFFTGLSLLFAFYYADTASGLSVFFFTAVLCQILALAQNIYNETYKDSLTGLDSRNSYIIHAKNLPLKYSIGIISIDDYDKLGINFGRRIRNILTKLIADRIIELEKDENIYRYSPDEFVIVYKSLDKNEGFERLETLRRAIASAQFQFSPRRKPIKLTVSASISEKKRSDANSFEVLVRADKVLQKTRSFSHNVTSKA